jgi:hypothetical protein
MLPGVDGDKNKKTNEKGPSVDSPLPMKKFSFIYFNKKFLQLNT